jgi:hypothetical protein
MSPETTELEQPLKHIRSKSSNNRMTELEIPTNWMQDEGYTYECVSQA